MRNLISAIFLFSFFVVEAQSVITRSNVPFADLVISDKLVVWSEYVKDNYEISVYNGEKIEQVTNNSSSDKMPAVSGSNYSWVNKDNGTYSVVYQGKGRSKTIFESKNEIVELKMDSVFVAWITQSGSVFSIHFFDGKSEKEISSSSSKKTDLTMSKEVLVWRERKASSYEIMMFDKNQIKQLTHNTNDEYEPCVSGNKIIWRGISASNRPEIFLYQNGSITEVTASSTSEYEPQISGDIIVWRAHDGSDYEIYMYDGKETKQLSDNTTFDAAPLITSTGKVVWRTFDGNDYELFMYNGTSLVQLTDNDINDVGACVAGNSLVWRVKEAEGYEAIGFVKRMH